MSITWTESPRRYGYRVARKVGKEYVIQYFEACAPSDVAMLAYCSAATRTLLEERIRVGKALAHQDAIAFDEKLEARQKALQADRTKGVSPKPARPEGSGPDQLFPLQELEDFALLFCPAEHARWSFVIGALPHEANTVAPRRIGFERNNVATRLELALQAWGRDKAKALRQQAHDAVRLVPLVRFLKSVDPHF